MLTCALAHPASELQEAWKNRDEEALRALHTPTCWSDELDSGRRLYQQIVDKSLEFRLVESRESNDRALAVFDVYRNEELVDRVFTYLEDDLVVAYDELEEHARLFLMEVVPGRLRLDELTGSPRLDELGRRYLQEPTAEFARHFVGDIEFVRSHRLPQTGRALLVYRGAGEEFALVAALQGLDWHPMEITYLPGVDDLIPGDSGLLECAQSMKMAVEELEEARANSDGYPPELGDKHSCPVSGLPYRYAVTIDFQWYGLVCEGNNHGVAHYPAASRSSGLRLNSTGHTDYGRCSDNIEKLLAMLEDYKALHGRYPQVPAYLADQPGVHLPNCSSGQGIRAHNETDYALMHLPGGLHVFCTTVEHCCQGFEPLQPSYINGLPAKAMFLLKTNPASTRPPAPQSP